MKSLSQRAFILLFAPVLSMALVPSTAQAKSSVHIDLPGFHIGFDNSHHGKRRHSKRGHRYYNDGYRGYRSHKRHYKRHHNYRGRYYSNDRYPRSYSYSPYYYDDRYYSRPRSDYYGNVYRRPNCPTAGFSWNYYDDRDCYKHKNHFHCDG